MLHDDTIVPVLVFDKVHAENVSFLELTAVLAYVGKLARPGAGREGLGMTQFDILCLRQYNTVCSIWRLPFPVFVIFNMYPHVDYVERRYQYANDSIVNSLYSGGYDVRDQNIMEP